MRLVSSSSYPILESAEGVPLVTPTDVPSYEVGRSQGFLGQLGFKIEPAGKIRAFAMVDA